VRIDAPGIFAPKAPGCHPRRQARGINPDCVRYARKIHRLRVNLLTDGE